MTKILIVEDEAGLRQGLEINLRHENYETVAAGDGEEAIRLYHAENPDLILLDLMLPKRSGFEVLDHIRSEEHTSELQSRSDLVCRLLLEKKKTKLYNLPFQIQKKTTINQL